ncbi:MAG: UDP-N-acetylmuramate dehydrogenase [Deltaproteobacteria bacterium]|nr:UDP-N-acetylmuramate dehydrogenase [Deltaproteobacteria bacterium]
MQVARDVSLAGKTTLGIGGAAREFVRVATVDELREALATSEPVLILGGGSNLVVGDGGFAGRVVQPGMTAIAYDGDEVRVEAGVVWDELVAQMVDEGRAGLECMSGIPGLVGATPMQNVGAYGQEVSDTIVRVEALYRETREVVTFSPEQCRFGYRTSAFKATSRWVITSVTFRLRRGESRPRYAELTKALAIAEGGTAPLARVRETVIGLRRGKGMVVDAADPESRSAGSFFTNPIVEPAVVARLDARFGAAMPRWPQPDGMVKLSAGWLIERAGFTKGYTVGRVGISKKHALALVNRGGASAAELLALAREIQDGVRAQLGVQLELEPVVV